ncbi:endonuclease/exonuclease/phosphatase family protein [Paenibacillus arenilitoris]|uniref:Endonuclease/exonuclease/phosphatase family protein n=1 Tax=Paenibacillus arenilitoris TaxID=2772299 RepID=A0A927CTL9_9BACL|nr:endonuclease/exonuclease/phosphatase family protein [Paenibacillus arenilitoris]MBD2871646.1 endonuclease/exonuclease/phosphatase family protein [Paenibacillus arenilitoris]
MKLPIMTFNLRIDSGTKSEDSWDRRSVRVAETIERFAPVIVGTQEGSRPMLDVLKGHLGHYEYVGQGRGDGGADEYCAIFYDTRLLAIEEEGQFWLSEQPETAGSVSWDSSLPRICTWAHFRCVGLAHPGWLVFNTHLDHLGQRAREEGILLIWDKMRELGERKGVSALLMGDLNAEPDNAVIRFLRGQAELGGRSARLADAYAASAVRPGATYHDFKGGAEGEPIDYIFATPDVAIEQTRIVTDSVDGRYPSDHYPVTAVVRIKG